MPGCSLHSGVLRPRADAFQPKAFGCRWIFSHILNVFSSYIECLLIFVCYVSLEWLHL